VAPIRLLVYSDYLCPWCYLADQRLQRLGDELGGSLKLEWRSYLLRPRSQPGRSLEAFKTYTRSWLRPAAEPEAPAFQVWQGEEGPPSHSVPPQVAAKAAARLGADAFARLHARLLRAYFEESRDISRRDVLEALWADAGLPPAAFSAFDDPALEAAVRSEHEEAQELGITGVPALRPADSEFFVLGAQPMEILRRWMRRLSEDEVPRGAAG
jgi:predicted DsbA family dithiol-disulfide isomerase